MMLTYSELQILKREVDRLKNKAEILDPTNFFERRELQAIICQLKTIVSINTKTHEQKKVSYLKLV